MGPKRPDSYHTVLILISVTLDFLRKSEGCSRPKLHSIRAELSWLQLWLNSGRFHSLWDKRQWVVDSPRNSFDRLRVYYAAKRWSRLDSLVIMDEASYCGPLRTVRPCSAEST